MEWLMLFPLLFFVPLALALWRRRGIAEGGKAEIVFDLAMPSKWAAELTQRALDNDGVKARVFREEQTWLCSVARAMTYQTEAVKKTVKRFDQIAGARGGECVRYRVKVGQREEVHACESSNHVI